jgi:hypothetical protein
MTGTLERGDKKRGQMQMTHFAMIKRKGYWLDEWFSVSGFIMYHAVSSRSVPISGDGWPSRYIVKVLRDV